MNADTAALPSSRPSASVWSWVVDRREALVLPVMVVIALIIFSFGSDRFLTTDNLMNVARLALKLQTFVPPACSAWGAARARVARG